MTLQRIAYPSPNYSSRGGATVRLIVLHTAEGSRTAASLGAYFADPNTQASSHVGIDDQAGVIGEYVLAEQWKSWTQADYNPVCVSAELCGFAAWTAAEWQAHDAMVTNAGLWVGEEAARFGIPLVILSALQAQSGEAGVCQHIDLGPAGGGHVDCDYGTGNFPIGRVIEIAGGSGAPPVPAPGPPATGAPPFPGTLLVNVTSGHGTATWQGRMRDRGWAIAVDDVYGPQSESVCRQFQAEKGLQPVDGIVGPITWDAAWTAPIT